MNLKELLNLTVEPFVAERLISTAAFDRINEVAVHLPEKLTSFFGFECRLGTPNPEADFLLCIFKDDYGHQLLANANRQNELPETWLKHPVWKKLIHFSQNWTDNMDHVWLEFDIAESKNTAVPIPSFFFAPYDSNKKTFLKRADSLTTILSGLKTIKQKAIAPSIQQKIQHVIAALPATAFVFQVGTMLARPVQTYRICIRGINAVEIPVFLKKLNWEGNTEALQKLLLELYTMVDRVDLDIDIHTGIAPKIGLECYIDLDSNREKRWLRFLNYLENNNLCTNLKKEALSTIFGVVHQGMTAQNRYPLHLQQMAGFIGRQYTSMYFRDIHHIKLSFETASCLEAKAYLRVKHIWASNAKLKAQLRKQHEHLNSTVTS